MRGRQPGRLISGVRRVVASIHGQTVHPASAAGFFHRPSLCRGFDRWLCKRCVCPKGRGRTGESLSSDKPLTMNVSWEGFNYTATDNGSDLNFDFKKFELIRVIYTKWQLRCDTAEKGRGTYDFINKVTFAEKHK